MSEPRHSPLPWRRVDYINPVTSIVAADGTTVVSPRYKDATGRVESDFELICRSVKHNAELLAEVELFCEIARIESPTTQLGGWDWKGIHERLTALVARIREQNRE